MEGNEFQKCCERTINPELDKPQMLLNALMGMCGESGEAIDILKKSLFQGHALDTEKLVKEIGDVMWYVAEAATALDMDLDKIMEENVEKLRKRYPEGFDSTRSINRHDE